MIVVANNSARFAIYSQYGVLILPESVAVDFIPEHGTVLIRIRENGFARIPCENLYEDVLKMQFDDIDQPSIYDKLFDETQAAEIVAFMDKHRGKKLVVHCQAGISRSSAVACAWAYMTGEPELEEVIRQSPMFYPNAHVYRLLVNEINRRESLGI